MDLEETIDPELLAPWHKIDVEYESFQAAMYQHEETAERIVVEAEQGPFSDSAAEYEVLLLPPESDEQGVEPKATLEEGIKNGERAVHEAEAIIATDKVDDYANN